MGSYVICAKGSAKPAGDCLGTKGLCQEIDIGDRAYRLGPSAMSQDSYPHLVPLSTLQFNLHRQLYPFDFLDDLDPSLQYPMSQPPQSPKTSTASPPASSSDDAERTQPSGPSSNATAATSPDDSVPTHACQWSGCDKVLPDPETLYNHLCNDHIGRKSTGNLCLTCKWKDCGTSCAKRDHITSHLRGTVSRSLAGVHGLLTYKLPFSSHTTQATCLRYLQEAFQATSGPQEA